MANESMETIVGRIDERTGHMEGDIAELKVKCHDTQQIVAAQAIRLERIDTQTQANAEDIKEIKRDIKNGNGKNGLSTKKKAGLWTGLVALVSAVAIAVGEYFKHH